VQWTSATWAVIKDIVLTGTGVWILVTQALSPHPSDPLLVVAMGLCAPAIYDHAKSLVSGQPAQPAHTQSGGTHQDGGSPSSPAPSSSSSPQQSSSPQEPDGA
jgi:hypothetical protein